jgi:hypothetical protein
MRLKVTRIDIGGSNDVTWGYGAALSYTLCPQGAFLSLSSDSQKGK